MRPLIKTYRLILILVVLFCGSFYFVKRSQKSLPKQDLILTADVINQQLPKSNLVNVSGKPLEDERLRHGKVVLIFMMPDCQPCDKENAFLKTVADSRKDVSFTYVIPFGNKDLALELAQSKYSLDVFYDDGSNLSKSLEIYQVPIKIFLEDGIIKKTWMDATVDSQKQAEFKDWLRSI